MFKTLVARLLPAAALMLVTASPALAFTLNGTCVSVYDGDTITVKADSKKEKIRLLGIDTPEMGQKPWGTKARDFTRGLVLNKDVRVETDAQPRDRYGRLLGYVYVGDTFVNEAIVREGHGVLLTYPPNVAHVENFRAAQTSAREAGKGIWDPQAPLTESPKDYRHKGEGKASGRTFTRGEGMQVAARRSAPAAAPAPKAEASQDLVSMNQRSGKYHEPGCRYYGCGNCLEVPRAEAERSGVPCKVCH